LLPVLRDALSACSLYGVLAFSFSGFTFPIEGMPPFVQGLSCVFPLRFYFRIYQKMALNGCEWYYEWYSFAALIIFMLVPTIIFTRLRNACINMDYPKG
ncbi:MAG: ABC transporter permease, partial [Paludibacteraceae bacterium]|nr:ABC transporter permease [Paludibacteraceae bacterium]